MMTKKAPFLMRFSFYPFPITPDVRPMVEERWWGKLVLTAVDGVILGTLIKLLVHLLR